MVWGEISQRLARRLGGSFAPGHGATRIRGPRLSCPWDSRPSLILGTSVRHAGLCPAQQCSAAVDHSRCRAQLIVSGEAVAVPPSLPDRGHERPFCPPVDYGIARPARSLQRHLQQPQLLRRWASERREDLATAGCPLGTHPAHLQNNRNCVLCLACAQAYLHRSVQLRPRRPPGVDLQPGTQAPAGGSMLILVLAGSVPLAHASGAWVALSVLLSLPAAQPGTLARRQGRLPACLAS